MAQATSIDGMITNTSTLGGGEIDSESHYGQIRDIEHTELSIEVSIENMADRENNDGHIVHIDQWVCSLERILEDVPQYMCNPEHPGRIIRIPENLREVDIKAYEPYFLSIGPYHHGKTVLQKMEMRKHLFLRFFLQQKPEITLKDYMTEIKSLELAARSFYSQVEMSSEEFVRMLLLDSMYIISIFCDLPESQDKVNTRTDARIDNEDRNDRVNQINQGMATGEDNENMQALASVDELNDDTSEEPMLPRWFWTVFMHDIFLVENQIPLFVVQKLYALAYGAPETKLLDIIKYKVGSMLWSYTKSDPEMAISPTEEVHHIAFVSHVLPPHASTRI